jgi:mannose-1-phosphate guanylyltransferase/mannose-6-phosphate isomerase
MCGGAGTRLWPLSTVAKPKPFHALASGRTLIQETALRVRADPFEAPIVVCNARHAGLARAQLSEVGVTAEILVEPEARNTGPCAVAVASMVAGANPDQLLLLLPADHHIQDLSAFRAAIESGVAAAGQARLVLFGIRPSRPATEYGYIQATPGEGPRPVAKFLEKPDAATARQLVQDPSISWNAGIFLFSAGAFLREALALAPEMAQAVVEAVSRNVSRDGVILLPPEFARVPAISIDYAVMEKTSHAVVVACDLGWSDIGAWEALRELADALPDGNALQGDVVAVDANDCLVRTDGPLVALAGVSDLIVVVQDGKVLVTRPGSSGSVGRLVQGLRASGRDDRL